MLKKLTKRPYELKETFNFCSWNVDNKPVLNSGFSEVFNYVFVRKVGVVPLPHYEIPVEFRQDSLVLH